MRFIRLTVWIFGTLIISFQDTNSATAAEPGWASEIVVNGGVRQRVEATPMVARPYRPLHFYGNTVRRVYYRGTPLPAPRDFRSGLQVVMRRPYVPVEQYVGH